MKTKLVPPMDKREMLYSGKASPEVLSAHGQDFLDAGRLADATDFFVAAKDVDGLARAKAQAIALGDSYVLRRIEKANKAWVEASEWLNLADRAWDAGRYWDALEGYARGGNESRKAMVEEKLGIAKPEEKAEESGKEEPKEKGGGDPGKGAPAAGKPG